MNPVPDILFVTHCLAAFAMCGITWFIQLVHYPLMHHVNLEDTYFVQNVRRTGWVVVPTMLTEFLTGALLILPGLRPEYLPAPAAILALLLLIYIWFITFFRQLPRHQVLVQCRYNGKVVDALVRINWSRTGLWSARAVILAWFIFAELSLTRLTSTG
jgi:hypothetical protein